MGKNKLARFAENKILPNVIQPTREEALNNFELKGKWKISIPNEKVILTADGENTILTVHCQHGQPVEFSLQQN